MGVLSTVCIDYTPLEALVMALVPRAQRLAAPLDSSVNRQIGNTVTTALGEQRTVVLADGADVMLNTDTALHAAVRDHERTVSLMRGEVVLSVPSQNEHALVLHVGDMELRTTSARLLARREEAGASTIHVLAGAGWLHPAHDRGLHAPSSASAAHFRPVLVKAGQLATLRSGALIVAPFQPASVSRKLAWTQGEIWLEGQTLGEAAAEFNRYNRVQLAVPDAAVAGLRIGGRFETHDVDGFVHALGRAFGIRAITVRSEQTGTSAVVLMSSPHTTVPRR